VGGRWRSCLIVRQVQQTQGGTPKERATVCIPPAFLIFNFFSHTFFLFRSLRQVHLLCGHANIGNFAVPGTSLHNFPFPSVKWEAPWKAANKFVDGYSPSFEYSEAYHPPILIHVCIRVAKGTRNNGHTDKYPRQ